MATRIQAVRGMNDILPAETPEWQFLERTVAEVLQAYGYQEIRLPIIEHTALFQRGIGDATDIVEKEMYTFEDRNGDSLSLRPEGTAGCVRAGLEHGLLYNQVQRLWYIGPMFRHERPQAGRYRQFHQIGVEAFGMPGPEIDAELILMTARMWRALGLPDVTLQINTLGVPEARARYREELVAYFSRHVDDLDEDSRRRLTRNPLRILDSKNPAMQELIANAPAFGEHLDEGSAVHFERLKGLLADAGIPYEVNPRLVRGLDYYTRTVFEWVTGALGAQGTVCAGGRYDGLVEQFGGKPTPAVGFAMGLERLIALRRQADRLAETPGHRTQVYVISAPGEAAAVAQVLTERLRDALPDLRATVDCAGGSLKSQFKRADRSGAAIALILAEDELKAGTVSLKHLRQEASQATIPQAELAPAVARMLGLAAS